MEINWLSIGSAQLSLGKSPQRTTTDFEATLARDSEAATELLKSHMRKSLSFSIVFSTMLPML
jgi:DNA-binding GntR family transcriptional regulator